MQTITENHQKIADRKKILADQIMGRLKVEGMTDLSDESLKNGLEHCVCDLYEISKILIEESYITLEKLHSA